MNINRRYFVGLDYLRSFAMLLGIVIHTIIPFKVKPEEFWPQNVDRVSGLYDLIYDVVHQFRMPLFFCISGFLSFVLVESKGVFGYFIGRVRRILLPLIASAILLLPLVYGLFDMLRSRSNGAVLFEMVFRNIGVWKGFMHLWFLYYLFIYSLLLTLTASLRMIVKNDLFKNDLGLVWRSVVLVGFPIILVLFQIYFQKEFPDVSTALRIDWFGFLYFGTFFAFGYLFAAFRVFGVSNRGNLFIGLICSMVLAVSRIGDFTFWGFALNSLSTCGVVFCAIGLAVVSPLNRSKWMKTVNDSIYWIYLLHLPVILVCHSVTLDSSWSIHLSVMGTIVFTFCILYMLYLWPVRGGVIEKFLNGKINFRK